MCGVFGCMGGGINNNDLNILKDLGIVSTLRGRDGAGIYQVKSNQYGGHNTLKHEDLYKTYWDFSSLLFDLETTSVKKAHGRILNSTMPDIIMGHVRAATIGAIRDDNSHPFNLDPLVGAHNGSLKDKKYREHPTKTDSEMMFRDMCQRGMKAVLEDLDRDSAFALTMYNKTDRTMYFVRNELRPLSLAFLESRNVMYWASEKEMLRFVLSRSGEKFTLLTLSPNILIKIKATDIDNGKAKDNALDMITVHCKLDRQLPTGLQKQKDMEEAYNKKKAEEAKAKEIADQSTTVTQGAPFDGGVIREGNLLTFTKGDKETKKVPRHVEESSTPRSKESGAFSVKKLYSKCSCGSVSLNLYETNLSIRGKNPNVRYNSETQTHHCKACEPEKKVG